MRGSTIYLDIHVFFSCSLHKCAPLFIARYSFIELSELELCRVTKQGLTYAPHGSHCGSREADIRGFLVTSLSVSAVI